MLSSSSSPPACAQVADSPTSSNGLDVQFEPVRFVGLDISKRSVMVAAVNSKQQVILQPKKVRVERFERWALDNLKASDAVVLEATFNAWYFYDLLLGLVGSVRVCDPNQNPSITRSKVKTDERDAVALAKLLEAGFITSVWVPPQPVRDLRSLITHRQRMSH